MVRRSSSCSGDSSKSTRSEAKHKVQCVLIILPPSESKRPPPDVGPPLDLDQLSFPSLNPMRARVANALIETSRAPDAFERLRVRPTLVDEVLRNQDLLDVPTLPAAEVYVGALHEGLGWSSLSSAARKQADTDMVICSALW